MQSQSGITGRQITLSFALARRILWALTGVAAFGFALALLWSGGRDGPAPAKTEPAFVAKFQLTDHNGAVRSEQDFAGRWMLIFFGFSNCPDVCPTTLSEVAAVIEGLGDDARKVQPIFISIDPDRDTPKALAEYVTLFDAGILGLTGTPEQIAATSDSFPIFYERIEDAAAPQGYTMSHTSHLFLFDREAGFADSWAYGTPAEEILADLQERI